MKIQFFGQNTFSVTNNKQSVFFNPTKDNSETGDCALFSETKKSADFSGAKKSFHLPGEFEISEILIRGFRTENGENTIYKAVIEDTAVIHFGNLSAVPAPKTLEQLGENIDVAFICMSEAFPAKKAKELIEKTEPRMVVFGGEAKFFAEISGLMNVKNVENNPLEVTKSKLPDENTESVILPL